ncbi:MAG: hypothetical protein QW815_00010 [Nitrososphaerota archaeon]
MGEVKGREDVHSYIEWRVYDTKSLSLSCSISYNPTEGTQGWGEKLKNLYITEVIASEEGGFTHDLFEYEYIRYIEDKNLQVSKMANKVMNYLETSTINFVNNLPPHLKKKLENWDGAVMIWVYVTSGMQRRRYDLVGELESPIDFPSIIKSKGVKNYEGGGDVFNRWLFLAAFMEGKGREKFIEALNLISSLGGVVHLEIEENEETP